MRWRRERSGPHYKCIHQWSVLLYTENWTVQFVECLLPRSSCTTNTLARSITTLLSDWPVMGLVMTSVYMRAFTPLNLAGFEHSKLVCADIMAKPCPGKGSLLKHNTLETLQQMFVSQETHCHLHQWPWSNNLSHSAQWRAVADISQWNLGIISDKVRLMFRYRLRILLAVHTCDDRT